MELKIVQTFQSISNSFLDLFMQLFTLLGSAFFLVFVFLVFYYAVDKKFALNFLLCATGVSLINYGLKVLIKRPRPFVASNLIIQKSYSSGYSFASGHSACISSISAGIIYKYHKDKKNIGWISLICALTSLLVGFSRIYLGHHYLTDVLAGFLLGGVLVPIAMFLLNKLNLERFYRILFTSAGIIGVFVFFGEWFIITSRVYTFMACGGVAGLGIGMILENKFVKFDIKNVKNKKHIWWVSLISIMQVAGLFLILNLLPKYGILIYINLLIVGVVATFVEMLLMKKIYQKLDKNANKIKE